MTMVEMKKFMALMGVFYQNWKPNADMDLIAGAWHSDLKDYSLDEINAAFTVYRAQGHQFPPAQPMVLVKILTDAADDSLNEGEAWALVAKARRNGIYGAQEEFNALPPDVQSAVGSPDQLREWAMAKPDESAVIQSNFQRAYRAVVERKKQEAALSVRERFKLEASKQK